MRTPVHLPREERKQEREAGNPKLPVHHAQAARKKCRGEGYAGDDGDYVGGVHLLFLFCGGAESLASVHFVAHEDPLPRGCLLDFNTP